MNKIIPVRTGIIFDTETTGIPNWKVPSHMPEQPHMTQLAAIVVDLDQRTILNSMDVVVYPNDWEIPQECAEINGITTEYAQAVGVPERLALDLFLELWQGCSTRMAFNITFDNRIIRIATKRYRQDMCEIWKEGEYECQMIRAKKHLGLSKYPKLEDAYFSLTRSQLVDAHNAMADVMATWAIWGIMEDATTDETVDLFT